MVLSKLFDGNILFIDYHVEKLECRVVPYCKLSAWLAKGCGLRAGGLWATISLRGKLALSGRYYRYLA
jgi:hypothetical protein